MSFSEIIGHKKIIEQLKEFVYRDFIPASIIFYGKEGIGKFKVACQWAKAINCLALSKEEKLFGTDSTNKEIPCEKCISCQQATKGIHPDISIIDYGFQANLKNEELEKQKTLKIETMREMIKLASTKPSFSKKRIFIVNDADTMTTEAQNSILKLIEEPSPANLIILIVSNKNLLLPTILSRCQIINFSPLSDLEVEKILGNLGLPDKEAKYLSKVSGGSVKKAMDFRKIMTVIKENSLPYELAPFLISSAFGKELWELRENTLLLIDLMINNLYYKEFEYDKVDVIMPFLQKLINYRNYIKRNVSPKYVLQLALINYAKHFDFTTLYKIENFER